MAESVSDLRAFAVDDDGGSPRSVVVELSLMVVLVVGSAVVDILEDSNARRVLALYSAVDGGDLAEVEKVVVLAEVLVTFLVGVGGSSNRKESIFSSENPLS